MLPFVCESEDVVRKVQKVRTDPRLFRSNITVRLELPAAREHEAQLKAGKEKKARESVPKF
jgi:hypothetical protein